MTANETVEYKANAALDVNLVLTVKTVDDATAQDQTLLKITPAPINNPCDANNCELLFSKGKTMTKTRRIFNRCVDRCVRLRLVRLYQAFGWECGTCEEDEEEE